MSEAMRPELAERRALLEQKRDGYKRAGYDSEIEAVGLEAQATRSDAEQKQKEAQVEALRQKARNCYAAAAAMEKMLSELPEAADA